MKFKAWAVVCGNKLCTVRATKESAYGHWADLTNASNKAYKVVSCTVELKKPRKKTNITPKGR